MKEANLHFPENEFRSLSSKYNPELKAAKVKPWGSTISIHPSCIEGFIRDFFPSENVGQEPSPRFLVVNAGSRLSWQKHQRRSELWRVVKGPIGIMRSMDDEQPAKYEIFEKGSLVHIEPDMRHRLIGLDEYGIIAEIWVHTDINNPSDANDITRLDDDYRR